MEQEFDEFKKIIVNAVWDALTRLGTGLSPNWEKLPTATILLLFAWLAWLLTKQALTRFLRLRRIDETLTRFLLRSSKFLIMSAGVISALGSMGVNVSTIVTGLGITGLVLGIALKDIVSNAVSGVMLLLFRPFRHHDQIRVNDFVGRVIDIDMRYTHLDTGESVIYIPNSLLFANAVTVTARREEARAPRPEPVKSNRGKKLLLGLKDEFADAYADRAA